MRIVSIVPSATEIVSILGCQDQLVGRSHECDFPPGVEQLPVCSHPRIDPTVSSSEIDSLVKSMMRELGSLYDLDIPNLRRLRPDIIITQAQCDVCAASPADVDRAVGQLIDSRPRTVALSPQCFSDVLESIVTVAIELGVEQRGRDVVASLRLRIDSLRQKTAGLRRPRTACLDWIDPLMAGGNWVPELLEIAGGESVFPTGMSASHWVTWDQLAAADPEVIVLLPCGFDLRRALREAEVLWRHPQWSQLLAVRSGRVYAVDGNQYFNRPGPRLVDSAEILAEILHFGPGSLGFVSTAWQPVQIAAAATV
jgi:iron complex transport system substrate-binding protein